MAPDGTATVVIDGGAIGFTPPLTSHRTVPSTDVGHHVAKIDTNGNGVPLSLGGTNRPLRYGRALAAETLARPDPGS